jgi:hypothetical protein
MNKGWVGSKLYPNNNKNDGALLVKRWALK